MMLDSTDDEIAQLLFEIARHPLVVVHQQQQQERQQQQQQSRHRHHSISESLLEKSIVSHDAARTEALLKKSLHLVNEKLPRCSTYPITRAASLGDCTLLQLLVKYGANVDGVHSQVSSVSSSSSKEEDKSTQIQVSIEASADIPLLQAIRNDKTPAVRWLLFEGKANPNICIQSTRALTASHFCIAKDDVVSLGYLSTARASSLSKSKDVKTGGHDGSKTTHVNHVLPLLHLAAQFDARSCCLWLIINGAKLDERDSNGETALMWAAFFDSLEIVRMLVNAGAPVDALDDSGKTAIDHAVDQKNAAVSRYLQQFTVSAE